MDGGLPRPARGPGAGGRRRCLRLPCRPGAAGARLDAAHRAGVGLPAPPRAAAAVEALREAQPGVRDRVPAPVSARALDSVQGTHMDYDVSVIGLGRVGLPLAL